MDNRKSFEAKENIPPGVSSSSGQRKSSEAWKECNEVITLLEHRENIQIVQDIVRDVVLSATRSPKQTQVAPAGDGTRRPGGRKTTEQVHHATKAEESVNGATVLPTQPATEGTALEGTPKRAVDEVADKPSVESARVQVTPSSVQELRRSGQMDRPAEEETGDATLPYESMSAGKKTDMNRTEPRVEVATVPVSGAVQEGLREVALDHAYSSSGKSFSEYNLEQSPTKGSPFKPGNPRTPGVCLLTGCKAVMSPLALITERLQESPSKETVVISDSDDGSYIPYPTNEVVIPSETGPMNCTQENLPAQQPTGADAGAGVPLDDSSDLLDAPEAGDNLQGEQPLESTTQRSVVEEISVISSGNVTTVSSLPQRLKGCLQGTLPAGDNVVCKESSDSKLFDNIDIRPEPQTASDGSTTGSSAQNTSFSPQDPRSPLQKKDLSAPITRSITGIAASEALPGVDDVAVELLDGTPEPHSEGGGKPMSNIAQDVTRGTPESPATAQTQCLQDKFVTHEIVGSHGTSAADIEDKDSPNVSEHRDSLTSVTPSTSPAKEINLSKHVQSPVTQVTYCMPRSPVTLKTAGDDTKDASVADNAFQLLDSASDVPGSQTDLTRSSTPNRASAPEMNLTVATSKTVCSPTIPGVDYVQEDIEENGDTSGAPVTDDASGFADEENMSDSTLNNITVLQRSSFLASNRGDRNSSNSGHDVGPASSAAADTSNNSESVINASSEKCLGDIEVTDRQGTQEQSEVQHSPELPEGDQQSAEESSRFLPPEGDIPDAAEHENGDDSGVLSGADASFLQAEKSETESVRPAQEVDNVGPPQSDLASPAARGVTDKLAVEVPLLPPNQRGEVLSGTSCNEKEEDGTHANRTECASTSESSNVASEASTAVETNRPLQVTAVLPEGALKDTGTTVSLSNRIARRKLSKEGQRSPSTGMDKPGSSVTEDVNAPNVGSCEEGTSHGEATDTSTLPGEVTQYFDTFDTTLVTETFELPAIPDLLEDDIECLHTTFVIEKTELHATSVDGGCIKPVSPPSSENSQQGMDFAGVANLSSSRLSSGRETALYDENVNTFVPQSAAESEEHSLPFGGCVEPSDPNDNTLLRREHLTGHEDGLSYVDNPVKTSEVKQLEANRHSSTVCKNPPAAVGDPAQTSLPSRKFKEPGKSQASEARLELKINQTFTVKEPPAEEAQEPSSAVCSDIQVKQAEGLSANEEVPKDSEAGPEVAVFSKDEVCSAFEHFNDSSAFDFLQKVGSSTRLQRSNLGRRSLYLKFDPLFADRRPNLAASEAVRKEELSPSSLPGKPNTRQDKRKVTDELIDLCSSPCLNLGETSVPVEGVPVKDEEQMFSEKEMSQALKFQELMFQERLLKKDQEQCEEQKEARARFDVQENAIQQMYQATKEIARICEDSSKERQCLQANVAQVTKERDQVTKERDQLLEDLRGVETAFSDFHRRYEQAKDMIRTMKENESFLRKQLAESHDMLEKRNQMLNTLKTKAEESLAVASKEIESSRKNMDAEITVLKAQLKRVEMRNSSLERQLEQKTEEVAQLTQMYDDLLNKVQQN